MRLATAPTVLVCHLKRFSCDIYGRIVRLKKHIVFPETLEIDEYMSHQNIGKPPRYELVAVLVHVGHNVERGHYIAFVNGGSDWYRVDDSNVSRVPKEAVFCQQAYMLFYEVKGLRAQYGHVHYHPRHAAKAKATPSDAVASSSLDGLLKFCCQTDFDAIRDGICFSNRSKDRSHSEIKKGDEVHEYARAKVKAISVLSSDSTFDLSVRSDSSNSEPTILSEKDVLRRVHSSGDFVISFRNGRNENGL
jgi:hypothetical protein